MLILPLPPTDNRLRIIAYHSRPARLIKSSEYRTWETEAGYIYNKWRSENKDFFLLPSFENQIKIKYRLFLKDKRPDVSNFEKALKDFLSLKIYGDDKWVKLDLQMPVEIDKSNPRVEITIKL